MLSSYARHMIALLTATVGAVTSSTDVRVQFLTYTEMLPRALHWTRVRI